MKIRRVECRSAAFHWGPSSAIVKISVIYGRGDERRAGSKWLIGSCSPMPRLESMQRHASAFTNPAPPSESRCQEPPAGARRAARDRTSFRPLNLSQFRYFASFFRAVKICIKAHYLQAVLLSDRILIRVVKIQMEPFGEFWQSEKLLWV